MAKYQLVMALVLSLSLFSLTSAGDPDITTDFVLPPDVLHVDGSFFRYTGLRSLMGSNRPTEFKLARVSAEEFPGLKGQSMSFALIEYSAGSVNPPHLHPHSSELLFVTHGSLEAGFVDTTNKLFTQTLQTGDLFIIPRGLIHYQYNANQTYFAKAVAVFGSESQGTTSVPSSMFATNIDDVILAKAFNTNVTIIQALKAGLGHAKA